MNLAKRPEIPQLELLVEGFDTLYGRCEQPEDFRYLLRESCRAHHFFRKGVECFYPMLGKVLLNIRENRLWEGWGYETYTKFLKALEDTSFWEDIPEDERPRLVTSRSHAYDCTRLVENFPTLLGPADCAEIGSTKLRLLSRVSDETMITAREWVERARTMSAQDFENKVNSHLETGGKDDTLVTIKMSVPKHVSDKWREFCDVQGMNHCETNKPGIVFEWMMVEQRWEWPK